MNISSSNDNHFQSSSLPQTFYDHVSTVIKLFRKQLTIFIKLNHSFIQSHQLTQQIINIKQSALSIVNIYSNLIIDQTLYIIVQRFIGRIKQILQLTNNIAPGFLQYVANSVKKIQLYTHKNINTITVFQIFSDILDILPSYFMNKTFSPQKSKAKIKQNKQNIPIHKKAVTTLDLILQSYRKSYNLLSIIDIDEGEYRSLFFSARDDKHRGTNYLQNEMKYRNRFIRQQMLKYDQEYTSYRQKMKKQKQNQNKKQLSKIKRMMSLNQRSNKKNKSIQENQQNINDVSLQIKQSKNQHKSYSPDLLIMQAKVQKSNLLTTYNFNKAVRDTTVHSNLYNYRDKSQNKQKYAKINQVNVYEKAREEEFQDFINQIKVKGQFRMTKVLFGRDGKLQLSPHTDLKPNNQNPTAAAIKNKIIFRKAQQNIRKKLNRVTTQPPPINFINNHNKSANKQESSPPLNEKKVYISCQPTQSLKTSINKKLKKFTWKDREIKFMGIKGVNSMKDNQAVET